MNLKTLAIVLGLVLVVGVVILFLSADNELQPLVDTSSEYDFSFSASPLNTAGESMLTWRAPAGSSCDLREGALNGEYSGLERNLSATGTYVVRPDASQIYSMICAPEGGSVPDMRGKEVTVYRN